MSLLYFINVLRYRFVFNSPEIRALLTVDDGEVLW